MLQRDPHATLKLAINSLGKKEIGLAILVEKKKKKASCQYLEKKEANRESKIKRGEKKKRREKRENGFEKEQ